MDSTNHFTLQNPVFSAYVLCSAILLLKTLAMAFLTARMRFKHKSFAFPEDRFRRSPKGDEVKPTHPDVERVRRAHLNDMENIYPFVFIGLLYITTNPSVLLARVAFGVFTVSRLLHTVVFLNGLQPARAICYAFAMFANIFMCLSVIIHVFPLCLK